MSNIIEYIYEGLVEALPVIFIIALFIYLTFGGGLSSVIQMFSTWMCG